MNTQFLPEDIAFRDEVRSFLAEAWTAELAAKVYTPKAYQQGIVEWQRRLHAKGWAAPGWPVPHGGTGWSVTQGFIYESERAAAGAPEVLPFGLKMVAPVIYNFGNEEQKQRFLPRILRSEDWWCQGYSEAGAGSDLAALKTRADLVGDEYVVNGAKLWTTYAQYADWIFCLVRTASSARKQDGITFLLIDLKTAGVTISPIDTIDGVHSVNEVRFEDVRVPVANRIGEQDKGWTYAKSLLAHERNSLAGVANSRRSITRLLELARREVSGGQPMLNNLAFQSRLADVEIELMALEYTELRVLASWVKGAGPGVESSLLKIKGTEIQQSIQQLYMDLAGYYSGIIQGDLSTDDIGHDFGSESRQAFMYGRAATIYGGSNEVQKNITAKTVLGL